MSFVIEVGTTHPRSEHDEMLLLIHCMNDVAWACSNDSGGLNGDVQEHGLGQVAKSA